MKRGDEPRTRSAVVSTGMRSRLATVFVWSVWLAMLAGAVAYVASFSPAVPMQDDLSLVEARWLDRELFFTRLWNQHNEHRIPLPRLVMWSLDRTTGYFLASSFVSIALWAAIAAGMIVVARRLRGHTSTADAFFPLLWLHTGNSENLLMEFQVSLALPTALVCAILILTTTNAPTSRRSAIVCAASLVGLPLCGGPGMLQGPVLAVWLAVLGVIGVRSRDPDARGAGRILLAGVVLTGIIGLLYLIDFRFSAEHTRNHDLHGVVAVATRVLALALGAAAEPWWPASAWFVGGCALAAVVVAIVAWKRRPEHRRLAAAIVVGIATSTALVAGIGFGRGFEGPEPGFALRYIGLQSSILCVAYLAFVRFTPSRVAFASTWAMAAVMGVADATVNLRVGREYWSFRQEAARAFVADVEAGATCHTLVKRHAYVLDAETTRLAGMLSRMSTMRTPPFDRYPDSARPSMEWPMFERVPAACEGRFTPVTRKIDDKLAAIVGFDSGVVFDVPSGARSVTGTFGALEPAWRKGKYVAATLVVTALDSDGTRRELWRRPVDAAGAESDRGALEFHVDVSDPRVRSVAIGVVATHADDPRVGWLWLRDVEFP